MIITFTCKQDTRKKKEVFSLNSETLTVTWGSCSKEQSLNYDKSEVFNMFASDEWEATNKENIEVLEIL